MKKRANNGMGSIRQRRDNLWEARYSTPSGQKSLYGKSEDEVARKLKAKLFEIDSGAWREPSRMTVDQWLDIWLADYQSHTSGRTVETYTNICRLRFRPLLGKVRMSDLTPLHVRRLVSSMVKEGFSASSIKHAKGILSTAMKCAVEAGVIKDNPVKGVKAPKPTKPTITIIDRDMFGAFVKAAQDTRIPDALVFMLLTGLRSGEVRGLKWSDIDGNVLHIKRQLHAPSRKQRRFAQPKDGELRDIIMPPEAVELLKRHKVQQAEQRLAAGAAWVEDSINKGLVFRLPDGWSLDETIIYAAVVSMRKPLNLPNLRPHDLRHSYAVAALRAGIDIKTVQHNLGHKHATITLDTYAAYTTDAGKTGAQRLSDYWQEALKTPD